MYSQLKDRPALVIPDHHHASADRGRNYHALGSASEKGPSSLCETAHLFLHKRRGTTCGRSQFARWEQDYLVCKE